MEPKENRTILSRLIASLRTMNSTQLDLLVFIFLVAVCVGIAVVIGVIFGKPA